MPMQELSIDELKRIMRECAGEGESVDLGGDNLDADFTDLGYDSLAVLEVSSRVERDYGVKLSDEVVSEATSLRAFLDLVNAHIR